MLAISSSSVSHVRVLWPANAVEGWFDKLRRKKLKSRFDQTLSQKVWEIVTSRNIVQCNVTILDAVP